MPTSKACPVPVTDNNRIVRLNDNANNNGNAGELRLPVSMFVDFQWMYVHNSLDPMTINKLLAQIKVETEPGVWGPWVDVKEFVNPKWDANFPQGPVMLMGADAINPVGIQPGQRFMVRLYVAASQYGTNGVWENADLNDDVDPDGFIPGTQTPST